MPLNPTRQLHLCQPINVCSYAPPIFRLPAGGSGVRPSQLEDCSGHKEDKTSNTRTHSDDMERSPAIAQLPPIGR
jgi:hypothetical protein